MIKPKININYSKILELFNTLSLEYLRESGGIVNEEATNDTSQLSNVLASQKDLNVLNNFLIKMNTQFITIDYLKSIENTITNNASTFFNILKGPTWTDIKFFLPSKNPLIDRINNLYNIIPAICPSPRPTTAVPGYLIVQDGKLVLLNELNTFDENLQIIRCMFSSSNVEKMTKSVDSVVLSSIESTSLTTSTYIFYIVTVILILIIIIGIVYAIYRKKNKTSNLMQPVLPNYSPYRSIHLSPI